MTTRGTRVTYLGLAVAATVLAGALSACGRSSPETSSSARTKLSVCINSAGAGTLPVAVARDTGLFAKYGLDVDVTYVDGGARAVAMLVSESTQLCQLAAPAVVNAVIAGVDLAVVGGLINVNPYALMVHSGIRSAEDLKGKAVAVSAPGSGSALSMRLALRRLGLDPQKDLTMLALGSGAERIAALQAGAVVGAVVDPPEAFLNRDNGYHALVDLAETDLPYQHAATVTTREFIRDHRIVVLNYMRALSEAIRAIKKDKDAALDALSALVKLDRDDDAAILEETYAIHVARLSDVPRPTIAGIQTVLDEIATENFNAGKTQAADMVDLSIVQELEDQGFFDALAARH